MNNLRLIAFTTTSLATMAGMVLFACSSDGTVVTKDGGSDAPTTETGSDDGGADGGSDTGPDGTSATDAALNLASLPGKIAEATCKALARCCFGNANLDGGAPVDGGIYDKATCLSDFTNTGFEFSNTGAAKAAAANVQIDQAKGVECLSKVEALPCTTPAATFHAARAACFDAFKGKVANGAACTVSMECGATSFCKEAAGGSMCAALRTVGQACGDYQDPLNNTDKASEICNHRASGQPPLYCDNYDFTAGDFKQDPNTWTCKAAVANGQRCTFSDWCAAGICNAENGALTCDPQLDYFKLGCYVK